MATVIVQSPPCPFCTKRTEVQVDEGRYAAWQHDWKSGGPLCYIQVAMPELSADDREVLISGTCPECWERVFGGDE